MVTDSWTVATSVTEAAGELSWANTGNAVIRHSGRAMRLDSRRRRRGSRVANIVVPQRAVGLPPVLIGVSGEKMSGLLRAFAHHGLQPREPTGLIDGWQGRGCRVWVEVPRASTQGLASAQRAVTPEMSQFDQRVLFLNSGPLSPDGGSYCGDRLSARTTMVTSGAPSSRVEITVEGADTTSNGPGARNSSSKTSRR